MSGYGNKGSFDADRLEQSAVQDQQVITVSSHVLQGLCGKLQEIDGQLILGKLPIGSGGVNYVAHVVQMQGFVQAYGYKKLICRRL